MKRILLIFAVFFVTVAGIYYWRQTHIQTSSDSISTPRVTTPSATKPEPTEPPLLPSNKQCYGSLRCSTRQLHGTCKPRLSVAIDLCTKRFGRDFRSIQFELTRRQTKNAACCIQSTVKNVSCRREKRHYFIWCFGLPFV